MKKSSTLAKVVASTLALGAVAIVPYFSRNAAAYAETDAGECYYINSNQISMTKSQYDLFQQMGFDEYEIETMSESKFDKLTSMNVVSTTRTVAVMNDEIDDTGAKPDHLNAPRKAATTTGSNGKYGTTDGDKILYTYVTLEKNSIYGHRIFVKQNLEWRNGPNERYTDILAVGFTNSTMMGTTADGDPDVEMCLRYIESKYDRNGICYSELKKEIYTGKDDTKFDYRIGDIFSFKCDLPKNAIIDDINGYVYTTKSITMTMETTLVPVNPTNNGAEIYTYFIHQNGIGTVELDKIHFSTTAPYVEYNIEIDTDAPSFDDPLYYGISIDFHNPEISRC